MKTSNTRFNLTFVLSRKLLEAVAADAAPFLMQLSRQLCLTLYASAKPQMQVKRMLGLHAFGVIKGNIKMIALLRGVIPTGKNRIPKMSFCDEILEMPD